MPAEFFCSVLALQYETTASSNAAYGVTVRISDGSQTQTLEDLLKDFDPVRDTTESSGSGTSIDTPPVIVDPPITSGADPVDRVDYLTFNTVGFDSFSGILAQLKSAGVQAAFFFTAEEMKQYPQRLLSAMIAGHTVGLTCAEAADVEDFLGQMEEANELLYSLMKIHTRIVQFPGQKMAAEDADRLEQAGYVLWDWTYDVPDSVGYSAYYVGAACRRAVERGEVNVLRMSCNSTVKEFLSDFLLYLQSSTNHTVCPIRVVGASNKE